jgi:pimeloyl-ACP methyl ester carboxylesterase
MGEYLASFGYVVMQVPVKGTMQYELDYEGKGLETQVLDYEFALSVLEKEFPYLSGEAAVAGFSFGGQSAVALALRNKSIKSVTSLDGGIGSVFGAQLLSNQTYYSEQDIVVPILHLYNPDDPYTDLTWFKSIPYSERFLAAMKNMQHGHFTSFGLLNKIVPGIMGKETADPGDRPFLLVVVQRQAQRRVTRLRGDVSRFGENESRTGHGKLPEMHQVPVASGAVVRRELGHRLDHNSIRQRQAPQIDRAKQQRAHGGVLARSARPRGVPRSPMPKRCAVA